MELYGQCDGCDVLEGGIRIRGRGTLAYVRGPSTSERVLWRGEAGVPNRVIAGSLLQFFEGLAELVVRTD
jgi:hypothetical protein